MAQLQMQSEHHNADENNAAKDHSHEPADRSASVAGDGQLTGDVAGADLSASRTPAPVAADGGVTPAVIRTGIRGAEELDLASPIDVTAQDESADVAMSKARTDKAGAVTRGRATPVEEAKDEDEMQDSEGTAEK